MEEEKERKERERKDSKERRDSRERPGKESRGRGRPPTTNEYVGKAEAVAKLNTELEKQNKLKHEEKIMKMTGKEIIESLGMVPKNYTEEAENQPTSDLINKVREVQTHILQVQRSSSNLKGTHQGALKAGASLTLGYVEALRTRMEGSGNNNAEMEILREKLKKQEEALRKMKEEVDGMRGMIEVAFRTAEGERVKAETERRNAEYFRDLLEREMDKKEDLERQLRIAKQDLTTSCWEPEWRQRRFRK